MLNNGCDAEAINNNLCSENELRVCAESLFRKFSRKRPL